MFCPKCQVVRHKCDNQAKKPPKQVWKSKAVGTENIEKSEVVTEMSKGSEIQVSNEVAKIVQKKYTFE